MTSEMTPYGIAIDALERILELDVSGSHAFEAARAIASEAHGLAVSRWSGRVDADGEERLPDDAPLRYALVEQMGYRQVWGTVTETVFCGRPMLEVTALETGQVQLIAAESLYALTWCTKDQAERATRTGAHAAPAITASPDPWGVSVSDEDDEGDGDELPESYYADARVQ